MKNCFAFILALACTPFMHAAKPILDPIKIPAIQQHAIAQEINNLFAQQPLYAAWKNRTAPFADDQTAIALGRLITFKQLCLEDKRLKAWTSTDFLKNLPLPENVAPALYECIKKLCKKACVAPPLVFIRRPTMLPTADADVGQAGSIHLLALSHELLTEESLPAIEAVIARQIIHIKEGTLQRRNTVFFYSAGAAIAIGAPLGIYAGMKFADLTIAPFIRAYPHPEDPPFMSMAFAVFATLLPLCGGAIIGAATLFDLLTKFILPPWHRSQEKNADLKALRLLKSPAHYKAFMRLLKKCEGSRDQLMQEITPINERYYHCKQFIEHEIMPLDTQAAYRELNRVTAEYAQQVATFGQKMANKIMAENLGLSQQAFPALKERLAYLTTQYKQFRCAKPRK